VTTGQSPVVRETAEQVAKRVAEAGGGVENRRRPDPLPYDERQNRDLSPQGRANDAPAKPKRSWWMKKRNDG
jgi:hypothetical protein